MIQCLIRYARIEDYNKVEEMMKQVQNLHVNWRPDNYRMSETILPYEVFTDAVNKNTFIVAELDEKVVGLCFYILKHIEHDNQVTRDILYIDSMAVDETYRGQGIGHKLFDYIKDIAQLKKIDGIELQVNSKNARARKMYEEYGFVEKSVNMELV